MSTALEIAMMFLAIVCFIALAVIVVATAVAFVYILVAAIDEINEGSEE